MNDTLQASVSIPREAWRQGWAGVRGELRPMIRIAAPLVLAEIGWMMMGIVDTIMVGRLPASSVAIGAASIGNVVFYVVGIFGSGLLFGMDTLVSQAYGAGRRDDCHRTLLDGMTLIGLLTPLLMGSVWITEPWLRDFGIAPEVMQWAIPYLHAVVWSLAPLLLFNAARRYLQGMNHVSVIMFALVSANLVNAFCNWVLIFGHLGMPAMGVEGAGWATCFSRIYLALVLIGYILWLTWSGKERIGIAVQVRLARLKRLFLLGLPAGLHMSLEIAVFSLVTALAGRLGALPLASHQVALQTAALTYMVPLGISAAGAVRVGQAYGAGDFRGAARSGWTAILLGAAFMSLTGMAFVLFPRAIIRAYTPDPDVIVLGSLLLFIAAFFQLFDGLQTVATGTLRGLGDTRTPMICHFLGYWVAGLPLGYALCFRYAWGAAGLWIGLSLALILIGIVLLLVWRRAAGRLMRQGAPAGHQPAN